ncbi:MAG TPA: penicillin acylase family protein [Bacteroidales bacterium]|nr:penicillin acylase family protein [Bacteroidales bacterium]
MKTIKRILLALLAIVAVALITGMLLIIGIKRGALPKYDGDIFSSSLESQVTVYRDERGMPHIYAENEHDLYFTTGYVMAQERLWQMDLIRRATTGRLSEIFGASMVQTDLFLRSLEIPKKSKMILGEESPEIVNCLNAFADGVNQYINDAGRRLPPEFRILGYKPEPWELEHIYNIIGYMGWDLAGGNLSADIFNYKLFNKLGYEKGNKLVPDFKAVTSLVFPDFRLSDTALKSAQDFISSVDKLRTLGIASFSGSNNWAISGSKSETGKPILSNDMHLGLSSPGIWIQIHQVIPGKLNVTGVAVPGQPLIVAGHNENIAWGMTNLMVDDIDLFAEKINPDNPEQYFFDNEWHRMEVRKEIIKVKGGDADTLSLSFTHRGPIVSGFRGVDDAVLSMRWSGYDMSDEIHAVYLLNRASDWEKFRTALSYFKSVSQNFVYADVEGNIGLNTGGGIPVRKGYGSMIRNGEIDEFDWKGYVPFYQLPSTYNPESGQVSSANNKTVSDEYPYYISFRFYPPYRIGRIREMLDEKEKLGIEDFKRMITDQHSSYAKLLTPHILKLKSRQASMTPVESDALNLLETWDYDMKADLAAPSVFEFFRRNFSENLLRDELGDLFRELPGTINDYYIYKILQPGGEDEWVDNINTPEKETLDDIISKSFSDCIRAITDSCGTDNNNWLWGNMHTITLAHPMSQVKLLDKVFGLNSPEYHVGGSNHTVCPYTYKIAFKVDDGASERHIFNTANWDESYTVIPTGASGVPGSQFYLSQTNTYIKGEFYKDHFSESAVKKGAKYTLVLKPGK